MLTREERKTLDRAGRRELRAKRRAERREIPHGNIAGFNLGEMRRRAAELILDFAGETLPGPAKMSEVLDELVEEADAFLTWHWAGPMAPVLELADGPIIAGIVRAFIRPHVQDVYEHLHDAGVLDRA